MENEKQTTDWVIRFSVHVFIKVITFISHRELFKVNNRKDSKLTGKMGKTLTQALHKRICTCVINTKIFNVISHQGNLY